MESTYLRTFLEIVDRGNFSEAAKSLQLSQPTVTVQIKGLENDLGVKLLERGSGKLRITPAGEIFKLYAEQIIKAEEDLINNLSELTGQISGELLIAASTVPGEFILPYLIAGFNKQYPDVTIHLSISDTNGVSDLLINKGHDIGFTGARIPGDSLEHIPFIKDQIVLIVPQDHPFKDRSSIEIEELENETLISREGGSGTMLTIRNLLIGAGVDVSGWKNISSLGSTQSVISGVQAGLGVSFVSRIAANVSVKSGLIHSLNLNGVDLERDLFMVHRKGNITTKLHKTFVDFSMKWVPGDNLVK